MHKPHGPARLAVALLAAPITIGLAVPASGDPGTEDAAFLDSLRLAGINYSGDPSQVIATAKTVCSLIGDHKSGQDVLVMLQERNPGLSIDHGSKFIGMAARSYCPNQLAVGGAE